MRTESGPTGDDPEHSGPDDENRARTRWDSADPEPSGPDDDESHVRARWGAPGTAERAPESLRRSARAAYAQRRPGAVLADLTDDSVFAHGRRPGPGDDGPRYLTYRAAGVAVRIEVTAHVRDRSIVGQVTPAGPVEVTVHWQRGRRGAEADADGAFIAEGVPPGPISLTVRRPAEHPIATSWTTV
ncbi:hypothetical protein CLV63_101129 [Murinocardiopsis flavida]|uniref:Carboxypeptidase regulatory-like domain-containing protein n=1 Tax=Murinocardiopsis flavida TaxID=645275 RepID=A0A2P8DTW7_9ACTN|nr:carboxypeptidase-like regulatory domain-containing protein [Murinocardiopsis flavida]PSL00655.1 hypothetical protein CLV63_101129 [Murinocardiopsis flavida]